MGTHLTARDFARLLGLDPDTEDRTLVYWVVRDGQVQQGAEPSVDSLPTPGRYLTGTPTAALGDCWTVERPPDPPGAVDHGLPRRAHTRPHRRELLWHVASPQMWIGHPIPRRRAPQPRPRGRIA